MTTKMETENNAPSYSTTGDTLVDLFFKASRDVEENFLIHLLEQAWKHDSLSTLKIIFYTRNCRGGKGERKVFYTALNWLLETHPDTLEKNFKHIPTFGTYKDLSCLFGTKYEIKILRFIADTLKSDLNLSKENKPITLCAKWVPTEKSSLDRKYNIVNKLCSLLEVSKKQFRSQYLTPLRTYMKVIEQKMCAQQWDEINYEQVPSLAMKKYKKCFTLHDRINYTNYLYQVSTGEKKMNVARLMPHEIVKNYDIFENYNTDDDAVNTQWDEFIRQTREKGTFQNSLAIVDVSRSMSGLPITVSVGLGLLIAELNTGSFHNKWMTFSKNPVLEELNGDTLADKINNMDKYNWSMNTDLIKAFKTILSHAKLFNTPQEQMPKTLFILSDMQFDKACGRPEKTNWNAINEEYQEAGYERPNIVFWNLNSKYMDFPVPDSSIPKCSLVSGFSADLLELFYDGREMNARQLVEKAIRNKQYDVLVV